MSDKEEKPKTEEAPAATEEPKKESKEAAAAEEKPAKKEKKDKKDAVEEKPAKVSKKASKKDVKKSASKKDVKKEEKKEEAAPEYDVIVHAMPSALHAPSSSPFVLKLLTFLRVADVKYKLDTTKGQWTGQRKGKMPWIEIPSSGKKFEDTQHIIEYFRKRKESSIDLEQLLSPTELAVARAFREMIESHYYFTHTSILYNGENNDFVKQLWGITGTFAKLGAASQIKKQRNNAIAQGMGRHNTEEITRFARQDLQAVSVYLGDNQYLMGSDKPTVVDCSLFGHLAQTLYHSPTADNKAKSFLQKKCKNLVSYVERIREKFYPDWDKLCATPIPTTAEQAVIDAKREADEKAAKEKAEKDKAEKEAKEKAAKEKADAEKAEREAKEKADKEAKAKEKAEKEKAAKEKKEKEKAEKAKAKEAKAKEKAAEKKEEPKEAEKKEEPKKEEPKKEEPKKEEPKKEEPKKEEPKKEEPKAEEPKKEEPKEEEAKKEEPKAEEPKKEEPKAEEPKKEEPKAEEPKKEEPKAEEPKKEEPKAEEPKKEEPKAAEETTEAKEEAEKA